MLDQEEKVALNIDCHEWLETLLQLKQEVFDSSLGVLEELVIFVDHLENAELVLREKIKDLEQA